MATYKSKITNVDKYTLNTDNVLTDHLNVTVEITKSEDGADDVITEKKLLFPLDASQDEIKAEVGKVVAIFIEDEDRNEQLKTVNEANKKADQVIADLTGLEI